MNLSSMQLNGNIIERENSLKFLSVIIERHVGAKGEGGQGGRNPPTFNIISLFGTFFVSGQFESAGYMKIL